MNMLTVKEVAEYMRLSEQTIQRYVLNKEIPFHKVKKVIRFRFSEIEKWIDSGGGDCPDFSAAGREGDLFAVAEGGEPCCSPAADSLGVCAANSSEEKYD